MQQIMKNITGEINHIEETPKLQTPNFNETNQIDQPQALIFEINQLQNQIEGMESSKFWKLRKIWMKVKRKLGLTTE